MMSRIDRIRRAVSARGASRTEVEQPEEAFELVGVNLPVPVTPVQRTRTFRDERRHAGSEFATQLIGQDGERRGLRAGPPAFNAARAAYNSVEWSGPYDRRKPRGTLRRDVI